MPASLPPIPNPLPMSMGGTGNNSFANGYVVTTTGTQLVNSTEFYYDYINGIAQTQNLAWAWGSEYVTSGASYNISNYRQFTGVNKTVGSATALTLRSPIIQGELHIVKDMKGDAGTNNITVTPASGTIDGAANYVINTNYGKATFYSYGSNWFLI